MNFVSNCQIFSVAMQQSPLESSSYCTFTWCKVKFPGSQCLGTVD
ncbi:MULTISPECIES: hypothetical protein [unclassified Wolbachia]